MILKFLAFQYMISVCDRPSNPSCCLEFLPDDIMGVVLYLPFQSCLLILSCHLKYRYQQPIHNHSPHQIYLRLPINPCLTDCSPYHICQYCCHSLCLLLVFILIRTFENKSYPQYNIETR